MIIEVQAEPLFELASKQDWINKVPGILPEKTKRTETWIWLDKNGNTLHSGLDFSDAEELQAYPVKVYRLIPVHETKKITINKEDTNGKI
jgi:hypothetical protein